MVLILGETSQGETREFQDGVAHLVGFLDQDNGGLVAGYDLFEDG